MALNFPSNPIDGQLYPDPAVTGSTQYVWIAAKGTWLTVFKGVERVEAIEPITNQGSASVPKIGITPATQTLAGSMTAADKTKLDNLAPAAGTVTSVTAGVGLGAPLTNNSITSSGTINLLAPTPLIIGGVKAGSTVSIDTLGSIDIRPPGSARIGGVKEGNGISIAGDGTASLATGSTFTVIDNLSFKFNSSLQTFQLTDGGVPYTPSIPQSLLIFIQDVFQIPLIDFSIAGSNITFSTAPATGATFYGISLT